MPASAPGLRTRPRPFHFTSVCQLNCTGEQPLATCRRPPSLLPLFTYSHTHSALSIRPAPDYCNPPSHSPQTSYNGPAQLILPARAVLCPYAGPLIDHQRASTLEHPSSRPSPTVSDNSSSYNDIPLCCNAGLIREELKASATFPPGRKVLTCASTSPTTPRPCVRCLAKRRGSVITGLRSCESGIL